MEYLAMAWTALAGIGLVVNLKALQEAKIDRWYVQHHDHIGTKLMVAQSNIRRERFRVAIQVLFLAAGLVSLMNPPTESLVPTRFWISLSLIAASVMTVIQSFLDGHDRQSLIELIDKQERELHQRGNEMQKAVARQYLAEHDLAEHKKHSP